jgi:hypothetical protein
MATSPVTCSIGENAQTPRSVDVMEGISSASIVVSHSFSQLML